MNSQPSLKAITCNFEGNAYRVLFRGSEVREVYTRIVSFSHTRAPHWRVVWLAAQGKPMSAAVSGAVAQAQAKAT